MKEEQAPQQSATWPRRAQRTRPSRSRPLSEAARVLRSQSHDAHLGPYETRYDIQDGYGLDRSIIRP